MKKVFLIIMILSATLCKAQDSLHVANIQLKLRTVLMMAPSIANFSDSASFGFFMRLRTIAKADQNYAMTATVTIDTIPTIVLANIYSFSMQQPSALSFIATDVKAAITSVRASNNYLNTLCNIVDSLYTTTSNSMIWQGKRLFINN